MSQLIIFQNILNAHYPQFPYYNETYKYRKIPHLTYTSVKWLFGLKSGLRKSFLATYIQISGKLYYIKQIHSTKTCKEFDPSCVLIPVQVFILLPSWFLYEGPTQRAVLDITLSSSPTHFIQKSVQQMATGQQSLRHLVPMAL